MIVPLGLFQTMGAGLEGVGRATLLSIPLRALQVPRGIPARCTLGVDSASKNQSDTFNIKFLSLKLCHSF
jgi:hypothetical protein